MDQPEAVFNVDSVLRKSTDVWAENEVRLFGRLCFGSLSIGDTIRVPLVGGGFVETKVARFTEDLTDEWFELPFYDTVHAETETFCVCVNGSPVGQKMIVVPSQIEKHSDNENKGAITIR